MRHLFKASLIVCPLVAMLPAMAQDEGKPVPVEKAAYHWPVFRNEHVIVLRVHFLPDRGSNYHTHSLDQISVVISGGGNANQIFGKPPSEPKSGGEGPRRASYGAFSKRPVTHKSTNLGKTPFYNIVVALLPSQPGKFTPQARDVAGYTQLFDNERARAWRLSLEPGQTSGEITQMGPGMRISLDQGEVAELIPGELDRGLAVNPGDFYWQEPGGKRSMRNIGTSKVELIEFELK